MPPKAKFTREEIITAALEIIRENGIDAVTARSLGAKLNSSARPVFTVFENMDEVYCETLSAVKKLYNKYIELGLSEPIPFKGVGLSYIKFAIEEPNFFRLLFMQPNQNVSELSAILPAIDDNSDKILNSIIIPYGLDKDSAYELYKHLWIFTHGIAALTATNVCSFSDDEINELLTQEFIARLKLLKE